MVGPGSFRERRPAGGVEQQVCRPAQGQGEADRAEPPRGRGEELLAESVGKVAACAAAGAGFLLLAVVAFRLPHGGDEDLIPVHGSRVGVVAAVRVLPREVGDLFFLEDFLLRGEKR